MNLATVSITLKAQTSGFVRALQGAVKPLAALQQQATSLASSFRFIGGALALGGLGGMVKTLADAEDSFLGLKAAMSGSIKDAKELERNYQGLTGIVRQLALDTGFSATEISETATAFIRANVSIRQTGEALQGVTDLARAEGDSLAEIADIAIDITKAFRLTSGEFGRVADILVNASLASNVTIRQLGESFKYAAGIAKEYDQSAESTAAVLAVLGDRGQKASMAGTALRQIFVSLTKDFAKSTSTLKKYNISLFEGGELAQTAESKFRPLQDIILELGDKARTAGNFINIFQARALTAALGIADETSESFAQLVTKMGETGTAARLAEVRSQSLATQFARLKATITEFVISLGLQGGLLAQMKGAVESIRRFVLGLSQLNPRILQLISAVIVTSAQVALMIGGFVALSGAAAALLSPLGMVASALFGLTEAGRETSIFEKYGKELEQLKNAFLEFASFVGSSIGSTLTRVLGVALSTVASALRSLSQNSNTDIFFQSLAAAGADAFSTLAIEAYKASIGFTQLRNQSQFALEEMVEGLRATGSLAVAFSSLSDAQQEAGQASNQFTTQIASANAVITELQNEMTELVAQSMPASQAIEDLLISLRGNPEARDTVLLLEELQNKAMALESRLALAGGKNPGELLAAGMEIADAEINKVRATLGGFDFETQQMVLELEKLKAASIALGDQTAHVFDDLIAKIREARGEQQQMFTVEFGRGIQNGISQMVSGFLRGTNEALSAGEILKGALIAEFESMFQQIILKKLVFDKVFKDNFAGLGKFAKEAIGSIFNGAGNLVSGAVSGVGSLVATAFGVPSFADGGIVGGPMLAMIGDAGSSGRGKEAILPLDKIQGLMGGGNTQIILNTDQPSDRVSVREIGTGGMDKLIELTVGAVERNILQRGSIHRAHVATTTARPKTSR